MNTAKLMFSQFFFFFHQFFEFVDTFNAGKTIGFFFFRINDLFVQETSLLTDMGAIFIFIDSRDISWWNTQRQISLYLPLTYPIIAIWNNRIKNGRRIGQKIY